VLELDLSLESTLKKPNYKFLSILLCTNTRALKCAISCNSPRGYATLIKSLLDAMPALCYLQIDSCLPHLLPKFAHLKHLWIGQIPTYDDALEAALSQLSSIETMGIDFRGRACCSDTGGCGCKADLAVLKSLSLVALRGPFPIDMTFPAACKITWWGTSAQGGFGCEEAPALLLNDVYFGTDDIDEADDEDEEGKWEKISNKFVSFRFADAGCPIFKDVKWDWGPNTCFQEWLGAFENVKSLYLDLVEDAFWYEAWEAACRAHPVMNLLGVSCSSITELTIDGT
jgi:hypothetical protein